MFLTIEKLLDPGDAKAGSVHPVRSDLPADIGSVIRHAFNEFFKEAEILLPLRQLMLVVRDMQHPAMRADRFVAHPQEIAWRCVEIMRRASETNLMNEEFF